MLRIATQLWLLALAGCVAGDFVVGDGTPPPDPDPVGPLPTPALDFGVVTAPRIGDTIEHQEDGAQVVVEGLHTRPDEPVDVLALVAPYDRQTSWRVVGSGRTETTAQAGADDQPRYRFRIAVDTTAVWARAGLLALRVRANDRDLTGFFADADADACWDANPSWRDRVPRCGSPFTSGGIVLASTDLALGDRLALDEIYLDDKGDGSLADTAAYYQAIDAPTSLAAFRTRYLVDDRVALTYFNAGDLGIGREMHCGTAGDRVGCYVSNYGTFGGLPTQALLEAVNGVANGGSSGEFATVAMVYTPPIDAPNAVQFIVYGADEQLTFEAKLDTHGDNTAIPNNCLNCHDSHASYDSVAHEVRGARFLPFDPAAFDFSGLGGFRRADQEDAMRRLNQLVLRTAPTPTLTALVEGMYGGRIATTGTAVDDTFVPPTWSTPGMRETYRQVIAPYCRSCHASRDDGAYDFADGVGLLGVAPAVAAVVCGGGTATVHRMPNAEATQRAFWRGPARAYLGAMIDLRGPCTPE